MSQKCVKILLLDDDYESMQNLKEHLEEEMGWEVKLTAENTLLERLCQERFDLLLVDSMIHAESRDSQKRLVKNIHYDNVKWDRTGLEFVRRFRKGDYSRASQGTPSTVPIVILSAVADSAADGEWGKIIPTEHHVEKPFRLSDLTDLMSRLLQE